MQLYDLQGFNVYHARATSIMQGRRAAHGQRTQKKPRPLNGGEARRINYLASKK